MAIENMPIIERRRIEAEILGPVIRAFQKEFGEAKSNEVVRKVIVQIAQKQGHELAQRRGSAKLKDFHKATEAWRKSGALEIKELERSALRYSYDVTRCRYAEMYKELGLADLGFLLSCNRDFALSEGYNPRMKLRRTQTIMQGASHCDFRYYIEEEPEAMMGDGGGEG